MKIKKILLTTLFLALCTPFVQADAAGDSKPPKSVKWSFDGATGTFDRPSIQRGFQAYKEICASCHGMRLLSYRNLTQVGFSDDEVKAIAAEYTVEDGPDEAGDMFERPAIPSDRFVSPFPNENAARASNNGAFPPDLSLMIKARHDGANYVYSLLTGYTTPPAGMDIPEGQYYNPYFSGGKLAMAPPITAGLVDYIDGTEATEEQISKDVVNFLQWAAEPEMEHRKEMGIKVLLFLLVATILFYLAKVRIWANLKKKN